MKSTRRKERTGTEIQTYGKSWKAIWKEWRIVAIFGAVLFILAMLYLFFSSMTVEDSSEYVHYDERKVEEVVQHDVQEEELIITSNSTFQSDETINTMLDFIKTSMWIIIPLMVFSSIFRSFMRL